jgi:uncharacterized alkaline shock family protein YloU
MEGQATISTEVLSGYVADAAREVAGVRGLSKRRGAKVEFLDGRAHVQLQLEVDWGRSIPELGAAVQTRVREYLARMANIDEAQVDVVVDGVGTPA